jgi:hypothetical protein
MDIARVSAGQERLDGQEGLDGKTRPSLPAFPALPALLGVTAFYAAAFFVLTWPSIFRFRTHWFADDGDGLQNVWNLWWVDYAVTVLHQNPWHTNYLHYPYGTSLLAHTLNPFNGFVAIILSPFMPPEAVYNSLVTFGFVAGGVTAYLLAYRLTSAHLPSLLAGFIFTFSSFHFAHAEGHMQLVSLEWIPLFVLLWLELVEHPSVARGIGAALVLFLVILCDYYYFFYCAIAGVIILIWWTIRCRGVSSLFDRRRIAALGAFAVIALLTSGTLAGLLVWSNHSDPLTGAHSTSEFSLDVLAPVIYGGHWRFGWLTRPFWIRLAANQHESSVHLGFSVIALAAYAWLKRKALKAPEIGLFSVLLAIFFVLALGRAPQVAGKAVLGNHALLPYAWLETLFPTLAISGVPIRMMVMVVLSAAMLASFGFTLLLGGSPRDKRIAGALACLLLVEYLPKPIPTLSNAVPPYVHVLRDLPGNDGIVDGVSAPNYALYFQTIHKKPQAFGYLARLPSSVTVNDAKLAYVLQHDQFDRLWPDYRFRYVVAYDPAGTLSAWPGAVTIWTDGKNRIVDVSGFAPRPAAR